MTAPLSFLRPLLTCRPQPCSRAASAYLALYNLARPTPRSRQVRCSSDGFQAMRPSSFNPENSEDGGLRIRRTSTGALSSDPERLWPRIHKLENALDLKAFRQRFKDLPRDHVRQEEVITLRGRIWSMRKAGSKLVFVDIVQDGYLVQCVVNRGMIEDRAVKQSSFSEVVHDMHRGDSMSFRGYPHRTPTNEISLLVTELPRLLSRCTNNIPEKIANEETKSQNRYVNYLIDRKGTDILRFRSLILSTMRQFFNDREFVDVQTPILADSAGGAMARPFQTQATEFDDRDLALRIAPELWLKRLIVGGLEKIYEIGPSFRNEGIDQTHNPEFWTCEFYQAYTDLDHLISTTESLFSLLARTASRARVTLQALPRLEFAYPTPFPRLDFIPALEKAMKRPLPLTCENAESSLLSLFDELKIKLPSTVTVPRLLDKLAAKYLEPQCNLPTWIINHPECMSPLSKSFIHPESGHRVAARAELFVKKQEVVNCYEEENSPIDQRRKFEEQLRYKDPENPSTEVDEAYLEALAWGMPPTGGWGCGIERLVMIFGGIGRIADTMSFGNLRHVVSRSQERSLAPITPAQRLAKHGLLSSIKV